MQYVLLVYSNEAEFFAQPFSEQERLRNECADWHEDLLKKDQTRGAARLLPATSATTLRKMKGKLTLVDGPFAETKEILGGVVLLECENLDEAVKLSRHFPCSSAGFCLELRPVMADAGKSQAAAR